MTPSTKIVCPSCEKALMFRGPSPEGKSFKCPSCTKVFRVPVSSDPAGDEAEDVPPPRPSAARAALPPESISEDRDRRAGRSSREEDEETFSEEQEERRAPRRERKRKKSGSALLWVLLGGGGFLLLLCMGVVGLVAYSLWGSEPTWKDFSPPEGRFTATFPGTPKLKPQQGMGQSVQMYILEMGWRGQFAYSVAYNDLGVDAEAMGGKAVLDGAAKGMGGKILSQKDIRLQGHPGKEVVLEMEESGVTLVLTNRMYVVKKRLLSGAGRRREGQGTAGLVFSFP